jgi:serine/threonine-protein kinase
MLGRYALYEKIASGGMASVHIGRLLGPVGFTRTVAIKRMHPQFAGDPEFVSMFLDEARLAARIRHPNVVPTLDVVAMSGELFLVMEYVQGESLARLVRAAASRGERVPQEIVVAVMVGALHGLHAAHEAKNDHGEPLGIVHRDVSPHNVLVGTDGVARVLDFGVAKAAGRVATTREGHLKGKMAYMAPEQVRGTVTRATDVYAASVVLWEALTGQRLFVGDSDVQVLEKVLKGCEVPPGKLVPGLPAALDAVTMRGLCPDPTGRFASAREMARVLEESVPPVTASKLGDWVETAARDALEERSARIALIESDSAVHVLRVPTPPAAISVGDTPQSRRLAEAAPDLAPQPALPDDTMPTQLSSGTASVPGRSLRPGPPRWAWVSGAGVAVSAVLVSLVLSLRRTPAVASPDRAQPATGVAASVAASVTEPPRASTALVSPTAAAVAVSTSPSTVAGTDSSSPAVAPAVAPAGIPSPPRPSASTATSPRRAAPPSACSPPWYFDHRGVRIFKPECL